MTDWLSWIRQPLVVFLFVVARLSGLAMTAPLLASRAAPIRVRALFVLAAAVVLCPVFLDAAPPAPASPLRWTAVVGWELALGMVLGLTLHILFSGLQVAGQIVGQMSGTSLADLFDPNFNASMPVFGRMFDLVAMAVFLAIGGHRRLIQALMDSFVWTPPGAAAYSEPLARLVVEAVARSFLIGLRAAAPVMTALLLSILIMGLISRTLPQLNILVVGFSVNVVVAVAAVALSLGGAVWMFQDEALAVLDAIRWTLQNAAGG